MTRRRKLPYLLEELSTIDGLEWIRLMYLYPTNFPYEILDVMVDNSRICRYIDMPIPHCSDEVLKSMRRGMTNWTTEEVIERMRERVPDVVLRTTLIVGYPTGSEAHFEELLHFMEKIGFDGLGVFTYSQEENTAAEPLDDPVPTEEKGTQRARVMELQREISRKKNESLIGTVLSILIDRSEGGVSVGRTHRDVPEVDNEVFIKEAVNLQPGNFYPAKVVDAVEYDLFATLEIPPRN